MTTDMSKEEVVSNEQLKPSEKRRIVKNVIVISVAFMVQFTAYGGASSLQSSINAEAGLGTSALAAVYIGLVISNMFLPVLIIKWLGTKWAISVSFLTYMPYIAAQLWPSFHTLIPAGLIVGFGGGPLWVAKCTYISVVSEAYSKITNIPVKTVLSRFLGIFFMIFHFSQVWGNLVSSLVISSGDNAAAVTAVNASMVPEICGAAFLPSADAAMALRPQPREKIEMLVGIYLACMAGAAIIVAIGVDSTKRYEDGRVNSSTGVTGLSLLAVTLKLLVKPDQLMMLVICIFIGLEQGFFSADFNAAFVSCAIGTGTVGFVMMAFGSAGAIGCIATGYLVKVTGPNTLLCSAFVVNTVLFTTLLVWRPQADSGYVLYIIAVIWGLCDSVWLVQINAFCGLLIPGREEAAYANFRLWESFGYIISYLISPHLRISSKLYIIFTFMSIGSFLYFIVEYRQRRLIRSFDIKMIDSCNVKGCDNKAFQNE